MGDGFQFIDIIFFAMIAAFLVLRLRNVLGRRDGHEGGYKDPFRRENNLESGADDNVVPLPDRSKQADFDELLEDDEAEPSWKESELGAGLTQIFRHDPSFDPNEFLSGARVAFELILNAYASGDTAALKPLLSAEVFGNFAKVIEDRERAGETMEDTLVGVKVSEIVEAYMEGRMANVTVKFVTEQVNVTRDENGDVVDGNPNMVMDVTDFWTFARDTKSADPNWTLVATRSLD